MTHYCLIRDGETLADEKALSNFPVAFLNSAGGVVGAGDYLVEAQASPNNTIKTAIGRAYVPNSTVTMMYPTYHTTSDNVTIGSNTSGNPRIDAIVLYIDMAASPDATATNVAKFYDVQGTPGAVPVAPDDSEILTAIGASNPYILLGYVDVANGFTSISTGDITDERGFASITLTINGNTLTATAGSATVTMPNSTDTLIARATTDTMTNKRITKRTGTTTSSATPTINTDNVDMYLITAQTEAITSMTTNLSGTPTQGQMLWIAITGTAARAITWGTSFEASTIPLPTTTVTTARLDVGFVWNTVTSKWRCVAVV